MSTSFQSNLRTKSSEQLLIMVSNKSSWSDEELKSIIIEIENRDLINDEVQELKDELYKGAEVEEMDPIAIGLNLPKNEFENDLSIIYEEEAKIQQKEKFKIPALVVMVFLAGLYFLILFEIPNAFGVNSQYWDDLTFVFVEFRLAIALSYLVVIGLFIGKLYLISLLLSIASILGMISLFFFY